MQQVLGIKAVPRINCESQPLSALTADDLGKYLRREMNYRPIHPFTADFMALVIQLDFNSLSSLGLASMRELLAARNHYVKQLQGES